MDPNQGVLAFLKLGLSWAVNRARRVLKFFFFTYWMNVSTLFSFEKIPVNQLLLFSGTNIRNKFRKNVNVKLSKCRTIFSNISQKSFLILLTETLHLLRLPKIFPKSHPTINYNILKIIQQLSQKLNENFCKFNAKFNENFQKKIDYIFSELFKISFNFFFKVSKKFLPYLMFYFSKVLKLPLKIFHGIPDFLNYFWKL